LLHHLWFRRPPLLSLRLWLLHV